VSDRTVPQSLVPYLDSERAQFYLRISLRSDDLTILDPPQSPWLTINESDPLTRLIDAQILTDAGSRMSCGPSTTKMLTNAGRKPFRSIQRKAEMIPVLFWLIKSEKMGGWPRFNLYSIANESESFFILHALRVVFPSSNAMMTIS
jgi:hypothetical protein